VNFSHFKSSFSPIYPLQFAIVHFSCYENSGSPFGLRDNKEGIPQETGHILMEKSANFHGKLAHLWNFDENYSHQKITSRMDISTDPSEILTEEF